jgi:D-3-phosphoglycerate dehydrogenase / 2-oxoglutarate reductase
VQGEPVIFVSTPPDELTDYINPDALARLRELGDVRCNPLTHRLSAADLLRLAGDATIVVSTGSTPADATFFERAKHLLGYVRSGVEIVDVDLEAATASGVIVANTPGLYSTSVVEFTVATMVAAARGLIESHVALRAGTVTRSWGFELAGKVLGLIGVGHIGADLGRVAQALGMRVIAYDPYVDVPPEGIEMTSLDEVLRQSRFVSVQTRLTPETRHLVGARELALMRSDAYLINTARGPIVDEQALVAALSMGRLAGAIVDVFATEPDVLASPLIRAPRALATPHIASRAVETEQRLADAAVTIATRLLAGSIPEPQQIVNQQVLGRSRVEMLSFGRSSVSS